MKPHLECVLLKIMAKKQRKPDVISKRCHAPESVAPHKIATRGYVRNSIAEKNFDGLLPIFENSASAWILRGTKIRRIDYFTTHLLFTLSD